MTKNEGITAATITLSCVALFMSILFYDQVGNVMPGSILDGVIPGYLRGSLIIITIFMTTLPIIILELSQKRIHASLFLICFLINILNSELISAILAFYAFRALLKGINRKALLIIALLCSILLDVLSLFAVSPVGVWNISIHKLIFHICLLLIGIAMSNKPDKEYTTLPKQNLSGCYEIPERSISQYVLLSLVTCGIYYFYWRYCIVGDIRKLQKKDGSFLGEWLLIIFIPVYDWYWLYTRANSLSVLSSNNRVKPTGGGILYVVLDIILWGWLDTLLIQNTLNTLAKRMDDSFIFGDEIQTYPVAPTVSVQNNAISQIRELNELRLSGIISEEEFNIKKAQLLSNIK